MTPADEVGRMGVRFGLVVDGQEEWGMKWWKGDEVHIPEFTVGQTI
jgi:hypothetical protein